MSVSLTNRDDIIANSFSLITSNGSVVNVLDAVQSSVVGLPPSSLNTIEKLSAAISNDPNYFTTINMSIGTKAPAATTYTKTQVDVLLAGKTDDGELTTAVENLATAINAKQNKFLLAETVPTTAGRIFDVGSTKFRAINVSAPLSITTPGFDYLTIASDTYDKANIDGKITTINASIGAKRNIADSYTKAEVDTNIAAVVGAAPALLNTLVELSAALNNDANYATTITNALAAKAPINNPTFTGTVSGLSKTTVGLSNVDNTSDANKPVSTATTAQLALKTDKTTNDTALAAKAATTYVDTQLALKTDKTTNDTALAAKAATTYVDTQLALKTDKTTNDAELATKAATTYVDAQLALKTTKTTNDIELATKAATTYVDAQLALKTTKTTNDAELNLKAPLASPALTGTATATNLTVSTLLTAPQVMFNSNSAAPTLSTRSIGTKLVFFPSITGSRADYAMGLETGNMWFSIADNFTSTGFKWYGATNNIMTLGGTGNLTCSGAISSASSSTTGNATVGGTLTVGTTNIMTELATKLTTASLSDYAPKASPTFTGTTTISSGGSLIVGTTNIMTELAAKSTTASLSAYAPKASPTFTGTVYTNNIEAISPMFAINLNSGLAINSSWGVQVDTIASSTPLVDLTIESGCSVGTMASQRDLTVNGFVDVKRNLKVGQLLQVDNLIPNVDNEVTVPGDFAVNGTLLVDSIRTSQGSIINIADDVAIFGNLYTGTTNILQSLNPYWVAVVINYAGGVPIFVRADGGRNTATNLVRISGNAIGFTQFDFPAHPQGANYIVSAVSVGATATISTGVRSSTRCGIITRNVQSPTVFLDTEVHVFISAY